MRRTGATTCSFCHSCKRIRRPQGYGAAGLETKRPDLRGFPQIPREPPRGGDLQSFFIEVLPVPNETLWFHKDSSPPICTDLPLCFSQANRRLTSMVAMLLGVNGRLGMSGTMKPAVRDRRPMARPLARSVAPLLALPVQQVLFAHHPNVDDRPGAQLAKGFACLR